MLDDLNRTELQSLLRELHGVTPDRNASKEELMASLSPLEEPPLCPLTTHREAMEEHIKKNFRRLRTQLPGCNGKCVSFGCPDMVVVRCWEALKGDML